MLFSALKITDVDTDACVNDVGNAEMWLKHFAQDVKGNITHVASDFSRGLNSLSSAVNDCGVQEVQTKIDALAIAVKWANISTAEFDKTVTAIVGASDLWKDFDALATAILAEDSTAAGEDLAKLLTDWTSITGGCSANSTACHVVDGLLRTLGVVAEQIAPCEEAVWPAITDFQNTVSSFKAKNYTAAVEDLATGLDVLSKALLADSCGLKTIGEQISKLSPKLAKVVVTVESSKEVKILVGSADIYDALYNAVVDAERGDYTGFGMQMGRLLTELEASGCKTKACVVLEGLLQSLQLEANDFEACVGDLDQSWTHLENSYNDIKSKSYVDAAENMGEFFVEIAHGVTDCGIPQLAGILEKTAEQLGAKTIATDIGHVEQVLVDGADITLDLNKIESDFRAGQWSSVGNDIGDVVSWLNDDVHCNTFVCKLLEGFLHSTGIVFDHLQACEADLKSAENFFTAGASYWSKKQLKNAVKYWASGLNVIAHSVQDCGAAEELTYLQQEANVLGLGNVSGIIGETETILVHGADFYEELYSTFMDLNNHDYRSAGKDLGSVLDQLSQWTSKHACQNDFCYVTVGILEFFGQIEGSVATCKNDFEYAFHNFTGAFRDLRGNRTTGMGVFNFKHDKGSIERGIGEIGNGMKLVAAGVGDCHLQDFANILESLAIKLGIAPEVAWVEELLKIIINGVTIENEVGNACQDFSNDNWVGFGYNIAQLIKTLVEL